MTVRAVVGALALLLGIGRAEAHHSFAAEFDAVHPRVLMGTVSRMEWVNPHAYLSLDVREADGRVACWALELPPPNALRRRGLSPRQLVPGMRVRLKVYPAKDGRLAASTQWLELPGGRRIVTGTPDSLN